MFRNESIAHYTCSGTCTITCSAFNSNQAKFILFFKYRSIHQAEATSDDDDTDLVAFCTITLFKFMYLLNKKSSKGLQGILVICTFLYAFCVYFERRLKNCCSLKHNLIMLQKAYPWMKKGSLKIVVHCSVHVKPHSANYVNTSEEVNLISIYLRGEKENAKFTIDSKYILWLFNGHF